MEPEDERDYAAEMDQLIDTATEGSGWVPAIVAAALYKDLLDRDTPLLDGWLDLMAQKTLRSRITARAYARRQRERSRAVAGNPAPRGQEDPAGMFAAVHTVSADGIRRRAGEMTGGEHQYVAETYYAKGKRLLMLAAFHRAVADRVGSFRTDEIFSLEEYERLYESIARDKRDRI